MELSATNITVCIYSHTCWYKCLFVCAVNIYLHVCICVAVWTGISVGYMCMGCTAACIDMYKGRGPLRHSLKGYGVH